MPAISVIMPVYNSENYLRSAIDSVLNQTFRDFELILIDDGSKDGSGAICDEYGDKDSRVVVVHQENTGLCGARNRGLTMAQGEYLTFIDNDDLYMPTLLEDNYKLAVKHHAGMVKFGRDRCGCMRRLAGKGDLCHRAKFVCLSGGRSPVTVFSYAWTTDI